jgi:hypothetical protein
LFPQMMKRQPPPLNLPWTAFDNGKICLISCDVVLGRSGYGPETAFALVSFPSLLGLVPCVSCLPRFDMMQRLAGALVGRRVGAFPSLKPKMGL